MDKRARDVIEMIVEDAIDHDGSVEMILDQYDIDALEKLLEEDERDEEMSDVQALED